MLRLAGFLAVLPLAILLLAPKATMGVTIQNDSISAASAGTPGNFFVPDEMVAAWLTTPIAGDLVGVQIFWSSSLGGEPDSVELAINIYESGAFPTPGALLGTIPLPTLTDTTINEFRFLDPPTNSNPLQIPVTAGQTFVVALEFLNQSSGDTFAPGVEFDTDGCQLGLNTVFTISGGWADSCLLGVTGDWGIRAIVNPIPEPTTAALLGLGLAGIAVRRRGLA